MDPLTLATTVVTKAVEEVGKKLPDQIGHMWRAIVARFAGQPAAEEAVKDLVATPNDTDNQAAFRKELRKVLETDTTFAAEFEHRLSSAQREAGDTIYNTGSGGVATGGLGPLFGVPVAVQDQFWTRGILTTNGSRVYRDYVPEADLTVIARLRQAGTILPGNLNLRELVMGGTQAPPYDANF
jgi:hypothetical protein